MTTSAATIEPGEMTISTSGLSRDFGKCHAVCSVDLQVPRNCVYGLLGVNGAGKSTLIKMLMGHLRPTAGRLLVLNLDVKRDLVALRRRVGYVSEERYLYDWMTVDETLHFVRAFYARWDDKKAAALMERFSLPGNRRVRQLSRGERARLCLLVALSYNPELIILDEPTSGLDPIVRRDFMESIVSELSESGATIFFSSHLVEEVERIADYVAILHEGRIIANAATDALKASVKRIRFTTNGKEPDLAGFPGILSIEKGPHEQVVTLKDWTPETSQQLVSRGVRDMEVISMSLEEIFVALVKGKTNGSLPDEPDHI